MDDEKETRFDPHETETKKSKSLREINTYDSPIDPLSFVDRDSSSRKDQKSIWGGIYKFAATSIVILTVIFAASELIDFIVSDMDAGSSVLKRIFGSSASSDPGDIFEMILEQTFGKLPPSSTEAEPPPPETPSAESIPPSTDRAPSTSQPPITLPQTVTTSPPPITQAPETIPLPDNAHPIISMDMSLPSYGDTYIYNNTALSPNVSALISAPLKTVEPSDGPLVLVIHTHGTEAFMPEGATYYTDEGELARSSDLRENMIAVGAEFVRVLEEKGIEAIHCTIMHDKESYRESYSRSAETIRQYLERYPSIRYVFDLHRDSIMKSTEELVSAVTYVDGERVAQVMPVVGSGFTGYEHNLSFALKLRTLLNQGHTSISRPVCLRESQYNQSLAPVSLLLEIGTSGNSLSEAKRAAVLSAEAIAVLIEQQSPHQ